MKKLKIAFFTWEYPPCIVGGLGAYSRDVTKTFAEMGHKVDVFTLNPMRKRKEECEYCERKHICELPVHEFYGGVEVHRPLIFDATSPLECISEELKRWGNAKSLFADIFTFNMLAASKFVNKLIFYHDFDIASVHEWICAVAGMVIKDNTSLSTVFHVHSTEELRSNLSEMIKALEHKFAEKADGIITVSYAMKEHLISIGYPEEKIHVVWNGINPKEVDPKKVKKKDVEKWRKRHGINEERAVLFIGRLTGIKGVENLVRAFALVVKRFPQTKLVIIGKGDEESKITQLVRELGIEDKVSLCFEFLPRKDVLANYKLADTCVFPSFAEPFGIVCLEAMAMEKPVVVASQGVVGFREQVINEGEEKCGVYINQFDINDIARGICEILENPEQAKEMGKKARKRVLENFTIKHTAKRTLEIYRSVIEGARK